MLEEGTSPVPEESTSPMPEGGTSPVTRLWEIIARPGEVFRDIAKDTRVLVPALIILALNVALAFLILPESKSFTEGLLVEQGVPPDVIRMSLKGIAVTVVLAALAVPPLIWLVQAAVLAIFNQIALGQAKFKQLFTLAFYAWIPVFLGGALKSLLVKGLGYKTALSIRTSAALLLPQDSGFLFHFLNRMDVFTIWGLLLLVWGGATIMNKNKTGVAVYVFILWLAYISGTALLAASSGKVPGI